MGQQQLLLVILVTIIVGIATVVAINTFGTAADQANVDAVTQDLASIAASAQGYYMRPEMLGGGGRSFEGISFNKFSFAGNVDSDTEGSNENGVYTISNEGENSFAILGVPEAASGSIAARVCADEIVMGNYDPDDDNVTPPAETECESVEE